MQTCNDEEASSSSVRIRPKGTGRKKIAIRKIENRSSRKVTFSKRRKGLFKKADQICRLCEAEIAIIVFSAKGRLFSDGNPSVEHVVNRFLVQNSHESPEEAAKEEPPEEAVEEEPPLAGGEVQNSHESPEEAAKEEPPEEAVEEEPPLAGGEEKEEGEKYWFEDSIDDLDSEKLEEYIAYLQCLRTNLVTKVEELKTRKTSEIDFLGGFGC